MSEFSFKRGYAQIKNKDVREVKCKIMAALNIKTRTAWAARLNGDVEPKVSEAKAIEDIFKEYQVKNIWGDA